MICDASVLVALLVPEPSSRAVLAALRDPASAMVSDFAVGEVFSAIAIKVRGKRLGAPEADTVLLDFERWTRRSTQRIAMQHEDMTQAAGLVRRFDLGLRMPDALHLALAQRLDAPIATLDRRQAEAARTLGVAVRVYGAA